MQVVMTIVGLEELLGRFTLAPSQLLQAVCTGINRCQEECMVAGKAQILSEFTDRTPTFLKSIPTGQFGSAIPQPWRATRQNPQAIVAIGDSPGLGDARRNILEPFEEGKEKVSHGLPVFIPTRAMRPTMSFVIPAALRPYQLLRGMTVTSGGAVGKAKHTKGGSRALTLFSYFLIASKTNERADGIWERIGPGKSGIRLVYAARQQIKRPAMLRWNAAVTAIANTRLSTMVTDSLQFALDKFGASS